MIEQSHSSGFRVYWRFVVWLASLCLVSAFVLSAWVHLGNQYFLVKAIADYKLIGTDAAIVLAAILPIVHILLALMLLNDQWRQFGSELASALLLCYVFAQGSVLYRGDQVGCGCFGFEGSPIGLWSISRTALLFVMAGTIALAYRKGDSDRRLRKLGWSRPESW